MRRILLSAYKDSKLACWVEAFVQSIDTHVNYAGKIFLRYDDKSEVIQRPFIREHFCSAEMFLDLIKRGVISDVHPKDEEMRRGELWQEVQRTIEECRPFIRIPLDEQAEKDYQRYREPSENCWYEIIVMGIAAEEVCFTLNLWGYKYALKNLKLPKMVFYEIADRLNAYIRFETDWSSLDGIKRSLEDEMHRNKLLNIIEDDLKKLFEGLRIPTEDAMVLRCNEAMVLLERYLREIKEEKKWKFKDRNIDLLINGYESTHAVSSETIQMLRLVAAPYRDHILHGRKISPAVAKVSLATVFECFKRLAVELKD